MGWFIGACVLGLASCCCWCCCFSHSIALTSLCCALPHGCNVETLSGKGNAECPKHATAGSNCLHVYCVQQALSSTRAAHGYEGKGCCKAIGPHSPTGPKLVAPGRWLESNRDPTTEAPVAGLSSRGPEATRAGPEPHLEDGKQGGQGPSCTQRPGSYEGRA